MEEREFMRMERELKKIGPQADEVGEQQWSARDSNYHKNILVEEREFERMERDCEADEHL